MSEESEFDVEKQIEYWRGLVNKDLAIAEKLIVRDSETAYGLFFVHMALEKIIKAHVVRQTRTLSAKESQFGGVGESWKVEFIAGTI